MNPIDALMRTLDHVLFVWYKTIWNDKSAAFADGNFETFFRACMLVNGIATELLVSRV